MENLRLRQAAPTSVNVTVGQRGREYLTDREVERLIEAAKQNRSGHRDATAILVAYRHGLRASELVALRWDDIDLATGRLHVRRAKSGDTSVHAQILAQIIDGREIRNLPVLFEIPLIFFASFFLVLIAERYGDDHRLLLEFCLFAGIFTVGALMFWFARINSPSATLLLAWLLVAFFGKYGTKITGRLFRKLENRGG